MSVFAVTGMSCTAVVTVWNSESIAAQTYYSGDNRWEGSFPICVGVWLFRSILGGAGVRGNLRRGVLRCFYEFVCRRAAQFFSWPAGCFVFFVELGGRDDEQQTLQILCAYMYCVVLSTE